MKKISIKYNPYLVTTEIKVDGQFPKQNSALNVGDIRLQEWVEKLPKILKDELRDSNFEISFIGLQDDYDDIMKSFDAYTKSVNASFKFIKTKDIATVEKDIDAVYDIIQHGPFSELKGSRITNDYKKARDSQFEINVVATMSSGKSTLINALLGLRLMPAANKATTATIVRIINTDQKSFDAVAFNKSGNRIKEFKNVTLEDLKKLNEDEKVSTLELRGKIPFANDSSMKLVLVDTPGPNNSHDERHKQITYDMLADSPMSLVLFVFNAEQLGIKDEDEFLKEVCNRRKSGGKQSRDRYIFVVNRADAFKPKEEGLDCVVNALDGIHKNLEERGIFNPNIFPVSSLVALEKRTEDDEPMVLDIFRRGSKKYEALQFENYYDYNHLPLHSRQEISRLLESAEEDDDDVVEIHSGIVSIEQAINLYIDKYARTTKIANLVSFFNDKLNEVRIVANLEETIQIEKAAKIELNEQIKKVKQDIDDARKLQNLDAVLNKLDSISKAKHDIQSYFEALNRRINRMKSYYSTTMPRSMVTRCCQDVEYQCYYIATQVKMQIEQILEKTYKSAIDESIAMFKRNSDALNLDVDISSHESSLRNLTSASFATLSKMVEDSVSNAGGRDTIMKQNRFHNMTISAPIFSYSPPATYFAAQNTSSVDMTKAVSDYLFPFSRNLAKLHEESVKYITEETSFLIKFIKKELGMAEVPIDKKLKMLSEIEAILKAKQEQIKKNEILLNWLNDVQDRINRIVEF